MSDREKVVLPPRAQQLKDSGNDLFRQKRYQKCIGVYTQAIEFCRLPPALPDSDDGESNHTPVLPYRRAAAVLFSNRATAYEKLEKHHCARVDRATALHLLLQQWSEDGNPYTDNVPSNLMNTLIRCRKRISESQVRVQNIGLGLWHFRRAFDVACVQRRDFAESFSDEMSRLAKLFIDNKYHVEMHADIDPRSHFLGTWTQQLTTGGDAMPQRKFYSASYCAGSLWIFGGHSSPMSPEMSLDLMETFARMQRGEMDEAVLLRQLMENQQWHDDLWRLDLEKFQMTQIRPKVIREEATPEPPPATKPEAEAEEEGEIAPAASSSPSRPISSRGQVRLAPWPSKRGEHSSVALEERGEVYVLGGQFFHRPVPDQFWKLNVRTLEWEKLAIPEHFVGRQCQAMTTYRGRYILVVAGIVHTLKDDKDKGASAPAEGEGGGEEGDGEGGGGGRKLNYTSYECIDVDLYDTEANAWKRLHRTDASQFGSGSPYPRLNTQVFVLEKKLYIFSGNLHKRSPCYDNPTDPHATAFSTSPFSVGHHDFSYQDMWRFDLSTRKWQEVMPLGCCPLGRGENTAVVVNGRVIVFGGYALLDSQVGAATMMYSYLNDTYEFTPMEILRGNEVIGKERPIAAGYFKMMIDSQLEIPRLSGTVLFVHEGNIHLWGGYSNDFDNSVRVYKDLWRLHLAPREFPALCTNCFEETKTRDGGKCPCGAFYCSRACQNEDWSWHKGVCDRRRRKKGAGSAAASTQKRKKKGS